MSDDGAHQLRGDLAELEAPMALLLTALQVTA